MMSVVANIKDLPALENIKTHRLTHAPSNVKNGVITPMPVGGQPPAPVKQKALQSYGLGENLEQSAVYPEAYDLDRFLITDQPLMAKLETDLGIRKATARIQILLPGQMTMEHLDDCDSGYVQQQELTAEEKQCYDNNPYYVRRFLILMEDWKPGQGIMFGKDVFTDWKKGDTIEWDWVNDVHSTFNTGFWSRALIRITGIDNNL